MRKGIKFRLYPTEEQKQQLCKLFGSMRYVYNKAVEVYLETKQNQMNYPTYHELKTMLYYHKKTQQGQFLQEIDPIAITLSLRNFSSALNDYLKGEKKEPRFKTKYGNQSITFMNNGQIQFDNQFIYLPQLGALQYVKTLDFDNIKAITISKNRCNQYFITINTSFQQTKLVPSKNVIGIDVGINVFCTTSNGDVIENPRYYEKQLKKLSREQKRLSRMQKGGKNYGKQCIKIAKIHQTIKNQRETFLHKLSTKLIRENQIICVEHLVIKSMLKNHRLAKVISSASWSTFFDMLEYKAKFYGRKIIKVNTYFPSSQTCSNCGYKNKQLKDLNIRYWTCPKCHSKHDRDLNASINIRDKGLKQLK